MSHWKKNEDGSVYYARQDEEQSKTMKKQKPDTAGKTENFFTNHVKLITFLVCLGVFLVFLGPISVFTVMDYLEKKNDPRIPMTEVDLIALSELDRDLYFSDIEGFRGTKDIKTVKYNVDGSEDGATAEKEVEIYYYLSVGEDYSALAIADIETEKIIYFRVSNRRNQMHADVLTDDIRAFLQGIPVETTAATTAETTAVATKPPKYTK